jgi:dUTP pyrophosphatase
MKVGVKIVLDHPDAKIPVYAKDGDAGADVYAVPQDITRENTGEIGMNYIAPDSNDFQKYEPGNYLLMPNQTVLIDLGFRMELPEGWEMQVRSRSGMAKRGLVVSNSPGTIDSGYRGPCMVLLTNTTANILQVLPGTRVAQFVLKEAPQASFEQTLALSDTDRGAGGFGSTGAK